MTPVSINEVALLEPWSVYVVNAGYYLVALLIAGAILAVCD